MQDGRLQQPPIGPPCTVGYFPRTSASHSFARSSFPITVQPGVSSFPRRNKQEFPRSGPVTQVTPRCGASYNICRLCEKNRRFSTFWCFCLPPPSGQDKSPRTKLQTFFVFSSAPPARRWQASRQPALCCGRRWCSRRPLFRSAPTAQLVFPVRELCAKSTNRGCTLERSRAGGGGVRTELLGF